MPDVERDIRIATTEDYQELFRICCLLHLENGQHRFSEEKAKEFIWRGCNRDNAIIGVIGPSDDIKAVIYLEIMPVYYSDDFELYEKFAFTAKTAASEVEPIPRISSRTRAMPFMPMACAAA